MNQRLTYSIPTSVHRPRPRQAIPVYRKLPRPIPANRPVQPLKGLWAHLTADDSYRASVPAGHAVCGVALSYRVFAPDGKSQPFRITLTQSALPSTAHYPLLTTHWTYTFSAKEKDPETGLSYFGSRYYSSDLSVWLSVDPMAAKYPSLSPYVYCADNPGRVVDPNGEEINPIYDRFGYFLGTDDLGLRGDAIIMDNKDFRQNMSHTEAMSKSTCFDPSQSFAAEIRYWDHYKSLKDRPDYDGYLTLDEANEWYRTGDGKPLFADLTKIDLSGFRSLGDSKVGKTYRFNLLLSTGPTDDGLVYGNLTFTRASNNGVRAFADKYDFDMKNWRNPLNWGRNIETIIGQHVAGEGTPYTIYLYGTAQLRSSIFAH